MAIDFNPASAAFNDDPYPFYKELRNEAPVYPYEQDGSTYWLISRYEDVRRANLDYRSFTSQQGVLIVDSSVRAGNTLATTDPPRHQELRKIYNKGFVAALLSAAEPEIRIRAQELAAQLRERHSFEIIGEFARPFFNRAVGRIIGIREADLGDVLGLLADVHSESTAFGAPIKYSALPALNKFMLEQVRERDPASHIDLMSCLFAARAEGAFKTNDEIANASTAVLLAGFSTVIHLFGNLLSALRAHPQVLRSLLADPALIPAAIEEGVRFDSAGQAFARTATQDVEVCGTVIPSGARVVLIYGSANRDERLTANPDAFDPSRPKVSHLGFGAGQHFCLGAPLARMSMKIALEEMLPLLGEGYSLDYSSAERSINFSVRGFDRLVVSR